MKRSMLLEICVQAEFYTLLRESLNAHGFMLSETLEVLHRTWHVEGVAVRPDHRMVAHTGFLTHARCTG